MRGDTDAMNDLQNIYLNGDDEEGIDPQPEKAFEWSNKSAEAGNVTGMFNTALYYAKGYGVERDLNKAAEWLEKAAEEDEDAANLAPVLRQASKDLNLAEQGDSKAQGRLAKYFMSHASMLDQAGIEDYYTEALYWAKKGADQNDGMALCILGLAYSNGRGVHTDEKTALEYYKKGAYAGDPLAIFNLGSYYSQGIVVKQNLRFAFELTKIAAENGEGQAMAALGKCYQFGWGCMGNMKKAVEWYKKSLEKVYDPELEHKVMVFETIAEDEDYDGEDSNKKLNSSEKEMISKIKLGILQINETPEERKKRLAKESEATKKAEQEKAAKEKARIEAEKKRAEQLAKAREIKKQKEEERKRQEALRKERERKEQEEKRRKEALEEQRRLEEERIRKEEAAKKENIKLIVFAVISLIAGIVVAIVVKSGGTLSSVLAFFGFSIGTFIGLVKAFIIDK